MTVHKEAEHYVAQGHRRVHKVNIPYCSTTIHASMEQFQHAKPYVGVLANEACYAKQTETRTATLSLFGIPKAAYTGTVK